MAATTRTRGGRPRAITALEQRLIGYAALSPGAKGSLAFHRPGSQNPHKSCPH